MRERAQLHMWDRNWVYMEWEMEKLVLRERNWVYVEREKLGRMCRERIGFLWRVYGERVREKLSFLRLELRVVYCNLSYFLTITNLFKKRKKILKKNLKIIVILSILVKN